MLGLHMRKRVDHIENSVNSVYTATNSMSKGRKETVMSSFSSLRICRRAAPKIGTFWSRVEDTAFWWRR